MAPKRTAVAQTVRLAVKRLLVSTSTNDREPTALAVPKFPELPLDQELIGGEEG